MPHAKRSIPTLAFAMLLAWSATFVGCSAPKSIPEPVDPASITIRPVDRVIPHYKIYPRDGRLHFTSPNNAEDFVTPADVERMVEKLLDQP